MRIKYCLTMWCNALCCTLLALGSILHNHVGEEGARRIAEALVEGEGTALEEI